MNLIVTHPGGAHKDDFLACCLMIAQFGLPVERRDPKEEDLADENVIVIDVGGEHVPERMNFDHHQFPRDHVPMCALSLVLQYLDLYEDACHFCDWLEPAEWFDTRGPNKTAQWLGVDRDAMAKLISPIDVTLLRRFAGANQHCAGEPLWEVMKMIGEDLIAFVVGMRAKLDFVKKHARIWHLEKEGEAVDVLFMPRTEPLPEEPSAGLARFIESDPSAEKVVAMVYPDRRGSGYGIQRYNDFPRFDFMRIETEEDVHFAHAAGFVAKTTAIDESRLQNLVLAGWK